MRLVDLSHTIATGMPQWRGDDQPLRIVRRSEHGPGSHQSSSLEIGCHVGTHIDAALHFRPDEQPLDTLSLDDCWGRARVLRAGAEPGPLSASLLDGVELAGLDFILFDTGWARHWGAPRYYDAWPFYEPELARLLATAGLKGTGLDTPSLDPVDGNVAHDLCAAAGMLNVENMAGLDLLPDTVFTLLVLPLKLAGAEASPVRAAALVPGTDEEALP
ncbi:MAG: cyclase family protein [bacterium]|nr:cyclase family protein [bacterium]